MHGARRQGERGQRAGRGDVLRARRLRAQVVPRAHVPGMDLTLEH